MISLVLYLHAFQNSYFLEKIFPKKQYSALESIFF